MSWGEVKKAINSTLGTEDFKSLDEIILGEKVFSANDNTLSVLSSDSPYNVYIRFKLGGTIRVKVNAVNSSGTASTPVIKLYDTSTETYQTKTFSGYPSSVQDFNADFNIKKDTLYRVYIDSDYHTINSVYLCGQVVDNNYFELIPSGV